ncbi:hypothetical protein R3P38DRAFT_3212266, partial [Favolaschia claudopus]
MAVPRRLYQPHSSLPLPSSPCSLVTLFRSLLIGYLYLWDCKDVAKTVYDLANSQDPLAPLVKEALDVIDEALEIHGNASLSVSMVEKTALCSLHLYAGALARRLPPSESLKPIPAVYIAVPSPFPTLETFIDQSAKRYNLDLFHCRPTSEAVESVVTPSPRNGTDYIVSAPKAVGKAKGSEGMKQALEIYKYKFSPISTRFSSVL